MDSYQVNLKLSNFSLSQFHDELSSLKISNYTYSSASLSDGSQNNRWMTHKVQWLNMHYKLCISLEEVKWRFSICFEWIF